MSSKPKVEVAREHLTKAIEDTLTQIETAVEIAEGDESAEGGEGAS